MRPFGSLEVGLDGSQDPGPHVPAAQEEEMFAREGVVAQEVREPPPALASVARCTRRH